MVYGISVDESASVHNQASLDEAQNGIYVVNIVEPSAGGVSHNKFR